MSDEESKEKHCGGNTDKQPAEKCSEKNDESKHKSGAGDKKEGHTKTTSDTGIQEDITERGIISQASAGRGGGNQSADNENNDL